MAIIQTTTTAVPKLTQHNVKAQLRAVGVKCDRTEFEEYRVVPAGLAERKEERQAYYTNDLLDALQTGLRMAQPLHTCRNCGNEVFATETAMQGVRCSECNAYNWLTTKGGK